MSKPTIISLLIVVLLLLMVVFPTRVRGDQPVFLQDPAVVSAEPVQVIQIPPTLPDRLVPYYLLVLEAFKDTPVMVRIVNAESGFDPSQKNPNSSASGLFQIVKRTWETHHCIGDVFNPQDNIACARKIFEANGTTDWNESKDNWR